MPTIHRYNFYANICGKRSLPMTMHAATQLVNGFKGRDNRVSRFTKDGMRIRNTIYYVEEIRCRDVWYKFWMPAYSTNPIDSTHADHVEILNALARAR